MAEIIRQFCNALIVLPVIQVLDPIDLIKVRGILARSADQLQVIKDIVAACSEGFPYRGHILHDLEDRLVRWCCHDAADVAIVGDTGICTGQNRVCEGATGFSSSWRPLEAGYLVVISLDKPLLLHVG